MNKRNWEAVAILIGTVAMLIAIGIITTTVRGITINVEGNHNISDLGKKGEIGCSGNPIPPTDEDMKNFYAGNFTSRQDDIMSGCYVINPPINIDCNSITYSGLWPLEYLRAIVKYCDNQGEK